MDETGVHSNPQIVEAVTKLEPPTTPRGRFLGVESWYGCLVKDVFITVTPLCALLKKKAKWEWEKP